MITPKFYGNVEDGVLKIENLARYLVWIAHLDGKQVEIVVRKWRQQRSINQNRYYWGVVVAALADHCGYTPEEMHEALKEKFLGHEEVDKFGLKKIKSSATLTTEDFNSYVNQVVIWAAQDLQCYIGDPNQYDF